MKVNLIVEQAKKAQRESRGVAQLFPQPRHWMGVRGYRHFPVALLPGIIRYPLYRRLGRRQGRSRRVRKISPCKARDPIRRGIQDVLYVQRDGIIPFKRVVKCLRVYSMYTPRSSKIHTVPRASRCARVASLTKHSTRMHHIVLSFVASLAPQHSSTLSHK